MNRNVTLKPYRGARRIRTRKEPEATQPVTAQSLKNWNLPLKKGTKEVFPLIKTWGNLRQEVILFSNSISMQGGAPGEQGPRRELDSGERFVFQHDCSAQCVTVHVKSAVPNFCCVGESGNAFLR